MIFLVGGFGLLIIVMNDLENGPSALEDPTLFFPLAGCILSVPSLIFNFKKLKSKEDVGGSDDDLLDLDLSTANAADSKSTKTSLYLWITNLIFGLYTFAMGLVFVSFVARTEPSEVLPDILFPIFLTSIVLFTGGSVIVLGRKR